MTSESHNITSTCAVVVTYRPPPALIENVTRLKSELSEVIIVDNSSEENFAGPLSGVGRISGVRLFRRQANDGIATGLNFGIQIAIDSGYRWIATFDQDSRVDGAFFRRQFSALNECEFNGAVALISPRCISPGESVNDSRSQAYESVKVAITSGSLIRSSVFKEVGFYDESLFMDYVDFDFCLRLRKAGYQIIRAPQAILHHRLGTSEEHSFLGKKITIKTHSAWRRYYIMRNRVLMYRRYAFDFPLWCLRDLGWLVLDLVKIILFEAGKRQKLLNVMKGIAHGIAGKSGKRVVPG